MIHLIEPKENDKVLEVGAGSGYLVAVLSKLCKQIFGIEVIEELKKRAEENLRNHKIHNVEIIFSDGTAGLKSHAPFDKIIVSAAATRLPEPLLEQLVLGGIMVIPKNISPFQQMLIRINKISKTEFKMTDILPVRFVPLVNS